jgi:hypothetical protein
MKYLTITPMYFHETNGQVGQIKNMQIQMPMHYKLNETKSHNQSRMSNEYRSKVLPAA